MIATRFLRPWLHAVVLISLTLPWLWGCGGDDPATVPPPTISVPAVTIEGQGTDRIGALSFDRGVGHCVIDGERVAALAYNRINWDAYDLVLFSVVAPVRDNLHVLYIYSAADTLHRVWHESYDDTLYTELASGSALHDGTSAERRPALESLAAVPVGLQRFEGVEITGDRLSYRDGAGTIEISDEIWDLHPFEFVDCGECASAPENGWLELHSIVVGPDGERGFGIVYLYLNDPDRAVFTYFIRLDPLEHGGHVTFTVSWDRIAELTPDRQTNRGADRRRLP